MTRTTKGLSIAGAIVAAFLVGFLWQFIRAQELNSQLDAARHELTFSRLEVTLGAATIEAQRGNYEPARELASDFFTRLQAAVPQAPAADTAALAQLLLQRDQAITQLSRGDSQSRTLLTGLFVGYRLALGEKPVTPIRAESTAAEVH